MAGLNDSIRLKIDSDLKRKFNKALKGQKMSKVLKDFIIDFIKESESDIDTPTSTNK